MIIHQSKYIISMFCWMTFCNKCLHNKHGKPLKQKSVAETFIYPQDWHFPRGGEYPTEVGGSNFWTSSSSRPQVVPLVENSDLPIRKIVRILLVLLTVMVLQKVSEVIFFKSNKFTAYKVKDGKDVTKSLMELNLLKLYIHFKIRSIKGPRKT